MDLFFNILTWILMLSGSAFILITGLGLVRFPDLYSRIHAGGVGDTLATVLILIGLGLQGGFTLVTVKLILIMVCLFFTSPTSGYELAHAAYIAGLKPLTGRLKNKDSKK